MTKSDKIFDLTKLKIDRALRIWGAFAADLNFVFGLDIDDFRKYWRIRAGQCQEVNEFETGELYKLVVSRDKWLRFLDDYISFDDLTFGGHMSVFQGERGYSTKFHRLLRGLNSIKHLKTVLEAELKERDDTQMIKSYQSNSYTVKRFCPHHGYDMIDCEVDVEGYITCPAHGWKFDLRSKKCVRGDRNLSL